MSQRW